MLEIFTDSRTSYSHNPDLPVREFPQVVGKQTVDSRPGRMPEWFLLDPWSEPVGGEKAASGNEALTGWCFKQSGVLRVEIISHHKKGEVEMPSFYTTKEEAVYTIIVKEFVSGEWVVFDGTDMQIVCQD